MKAEDEDAKSRETERRYAAAFRATPYSVSVSELATGRYVDCNDAFERVSGYARDEVIGRTSFELDLWVDPADRAELVRLVSTEGRVRDLEIRFRAKGGRVVYAICHCDIIETDGVRYLVNTFEDISDRQRVDAALREAEAARRVAADELRLVFESSPIGLALLDATGRPIRANAAFQRFFGRTTDELQAFVLTELQHPDDASRDPARVDALVEGSVSEVRGESRFLRSDGSTTWGSLTLSPTAHPGDTNARVLCMIEDTNVRRLAEQSIRESQDLIAIAFRASPNEMSILDFETFRYLEVNDSFVENYGYSREDVIGRTPSEVGELVNPDDAGRLRELLTRTGRVVDAHVVVRRRDGSTMTVLRSAEVATIGGRRCVLRASRDVTAQLRAEEQRLQVEAQLRQAQKLEALGTLAGGIAHDFNNILTASLNFTELAIAQANDPNAVRRLLAHVDQANTRAQGLVRQILAFSRRQQQERRTTALADVVIEAMRLLESTLSKLVRFETRFDADTPHVLADATQVHQVVMNLCTNAAHAIGSGRGTIGVRLERFVPSESEAGTGAGRAFARLTVTDDGSGMDDDTLRQIFDPFFTTKAPGEGTGLGLSVVHGIVRDHGGTIEVESHPGTGTTVRVDLPEDVSDFVAPVVRDLVLPQGRGERVLLVDDELAITEAAEISLARLGFRVTIANDPMKALESFLASPESFDAVVTDFAMPSMNGLDLARRMLFVRPELPVLLMSGYTDFRNAESIRAMGLRELLSKPISFSMLARSILRAVDGS